MPALIFEICNAHRAMCIEKALEQTLNIYKQNYYLLFVS